MRQEDYVMLLVGLEEMARLYKAKRGSSAGGSRVKRLVRALRSGNLDGMLRSRRVRRLGLDLPLATAGDDPWRTNPDDYFGDEQIVVYQAPFGGYDQIWEPLIHPDNVDYRMVTDQEVPQGSRWVRVDPADVVPRDLQGDPVLSNRWCKMHPHLLFPDHRTSIYLDSNILVVSDLTALARGLDGYPVAMFRHKNRDCVYQEIEACIVKGKDSKERLRAQEAVLRAHGVPEHGGLLEAPVIVRRHHDGRCVDLMDAWWAAFAAGSRRDQIALADALWVRGVDASVVGTLGSDLRTCDLFVTMPHGSGTSR